MNAFSLLANRTFATSSLRAPVLTPGGNADTITNSLAPFRNSKERDLIYGAASSGFFSYNEPSCGGGGASSSPGYGTAIVGAGLKAVPIIGSFLSAGLSIFGKHHAAAVKREQSTLCGEVPSFNDFLRVIDTAVAQGADTGEATQSLENAYSTFVQRLQPIFKSCNAACVYEKAARAAVEKRKQDYALGVAQNARAAQSVDGGVSSAVPVYSAQAPDPNLGRFLLGSPQTIDTDSGPFVPKGGTIQFGAPTPAQAQQQAQNAGGVAAASLIGGIPAQTIGLLIVGVLFSGVVLALVLRRQPT